MSGERSELEVVTRLLRVGEVSPEVKRAMNLRYGLPPETEEERACVPAWMRSDVRHGEVHLLRRGGQAPSIELLEVMASARAAELEARAKATATREGSRQLDEFDLLTRAGAVIAP